MQIGIPRGLGYFMYYPFWYGFFTELGIEVKTSSHTTKTLVTRGSALLVPETCLPVKIYVGHVLNLLDRGITNIYSPSIQSVEDKIYNCSKLRGLPDLIRNIIKEDINLIEPTLDKSVKKQGLYEFLAESVAPFGITNKKKIKQASKAGWACYNKYTEMMELGHVYNDAIAIATEKKEAFAPEEKDLPVTVAVCSHGYNVFDDYFSMRLGKKLEKLGANMIVPDAIPRPTLIKSIEKLGAEYYWANEHEVTGIAAHYIDSPEIDGLLTMTAFGCGPDSLMIERITRKAKQHKMPLLNLTIDEHTGEAGFITRLEAFIDMLIRKKRSQMIHSLERQVNCCNGDSLDKKSCSGCNEKLSIG